MTAVEPFKVNPSGPTEVATALGNAAGSVGGAIGGLIGARADAKKRASTLRDAVAIHQAQMEHEANMQQQHHENTLALIDHVTNASMKMDEHQHGLSEAAQEGQRAHEADMQDRYVEHAKSMLGVVQPGTQAEFSFGGGSFKGVSPLPAPVQSDDSSVAERRERRKATTGRINPTVGLPTSGGAPTMSREDSVRAARLADKVASNLKNRTQFPTTAVVATPKVEGKPKTAAKPRSKKTITKTETINLVNPGEQYND